MRYGSTKPCWQSDFLASRFARYSFVYRGDILGSWEGVWFRVCGVDELLEGFGEFRHFRCTASQNFENLTRENQIRTKSMIYAYTRRMMKWSR